MHQCTMHLSRNVASCTMHMHHAHDLLSWLLNLHAQICSDDLINGLRNFSKITQGKGLSSMYKGVSKHTGGKWEARAFVKSTDSK